MANCAYCGKPIQKRPNTPGPLPKYCSELCLRLARNERERQRQQDIKNGKATRNPAPFKHYRTKDCPICGRTFEPKGARQKYCSPECLAKSLPEPKRKANNIGPRIKPPTAPAADQKPKRRKGNLDATLKKLHDTGQSYAEHQKADTIKRFAHIDLEEE